MNQQIFISYSRKDSAMLDKIALALRRKGFTVWTDSALTPGTRQWKAAIEGAIEQSAAVLALMSPDAKGSEWVDRELEYARMRQIPVIPLLIGGDEVTAVPFELVSSQWINMNGAEHYDVAMQQLLQTLNRLGLREQSKFQIMHRELTELLSQMSLLRWAAITSVDGLTAAFVRRLEDTDEDRVSAMGAAQLSLNERITSELRVGDFLFSIAAGRDGIILLMMLNDAYVLLVAVNGWTSLDALLNQLSQFVNRLRPLIV